LVRSPSICLFSSACIALLCFRASQAAPVPLAPPAAASAPAAEEATRLALAEDDAARLTVPVMINGKGPFGFVIDTGANRTVISRELAVELGLPEGAPVVVHTTSGAVVEPTVVMDSLKIGRHGIRQVAAPVFSRAALGAAGMLGIDGLSKQIMLLDIKGHCIRVSPSPLLVFDPRAIVVQGKSLYGGLVLVDAHCGAVPIYVILDTGAQGTVANSALRRQLAVQDTKGGEADRMPVISVTGQTTMAEVRVLPSVTIGGVGLKDLPVAFADLHTFARFHLTDRPAMLLGMDVLQGFGRVFVDFSRKTVRFHLAEDQRPPSG
jgi:predicted aspartyl protease